MRSQRQKQSFFYKLAKKTSESVGSPWALLSAVTVLLKISKSIYWDIFFY
jgi:hypothetical protein